MKYSRNQLNKAGDILIDSSYDALDKSMAFDTVMAWRASFMPVLNELHSELSEYLAVHGLKPSLYSQRVKRMPSILAKLVHNQESKMKLGGLQDIGGVRFVYDDMDSLCKAHEAIRKYQFKNFEFVRECDYVATPKKSGYRSIHFIFKYKSENKVYDGLHIELQIRTKLQHSWAMAVETASIIANTALKANIDDKSEWRDFFKLSSAIFSQMERTTVMEEYADVDHRDLCVKYDLYEHKFRLVDQLKALRVVTDQAVKSDYINGYYVLCVNSETKRVKIVAFAQEKKEEAIRLFSNTEQQARPNESILLASIERVQEIKEAYPSYFLDSQKFTEAVEKFAQSCEVYHH